MSVARSILVIVFLFLGAVFAFTANATIWANRTVFDTDNFVSTANRALDDETVQEDIADRLAITLIEEGDVQERLRDRLPEGLQFLAPILTITARDLAYDAILRLLQNDNVRDGLDTALRLVHQQVMRIVEGEGAVVIENDQVVLDLGLILQRAAEELNVNGAGLLENLDLPEDAGQIVLVEDAATASTVQDLLSLHNQITWLVIGGSILMFALAVFAATNRRAALRNVGIVLVICGVLAVTLLLGIRPIASGFAKNPDAARAILDAFLWDYRLQSFFIIFLGGAIIMLAFLLGRSELATAIRRTVRRDPSAPAPDLPAAIGNSATPLRAFGLILGALTLAAWPEPTTRVYVTVFALLAAYFFALWAITSQSSWAAKVREQAAGTWGRVGGSPASERNTTLVGRHANQLRIAGLVVAVVMLIAVPNLGLGSLAAILALAFIYLALVDWLSTRPEDEEA